MNHTGLGLAAILAITSCGLPGPRSAVSPAVSPGQVKDFTLLYNQNCAGCHGPDGQGGGMTIPIGDPLYLAIADYASIRRVASEGRPGTAMPAFAQAYGGLLTDDQIDIIVGGVRTRWGKAGTLQNARPPAYAAQAAGDPKHGLSVFNVSCSSCHGLNGRGGMVGPLVNGSYLALVSNQYLRTTVIVGRPAMGMPDWRRHAPGPLTEEDVTDVVAWLAAQRPASARQPYLTKMNTTEPNASGLNVSGGIR
jgi:cytochrome c oxidase cbb3-type subunit 3